MPPPAAPKRIKRPATVLDEDTYTSAIAHIIRRDFFPGLAETDAQREYLNALESKDNSWIREAGKKLTEVMTPAPGGRRRALQNPVSGGMTPIGRGGETPKVWGSDTPLTTAGTEMEEEEEKKPEVDLSLSLSAFQAKYISEDQESFSQIIDRQNAKKFAQNEWLRNGNRHPSKQRLAQQKVLEAAKTDTFQALTVRPSQDLDKRPAAPTVHKHVPFNSLMFNPESVEDWAPTRSQTAEFASLAPPKAVLHQNTRLPATDAEPQRPPSPTLSAVRDAVTGRPRLTESEVGYDGSETPRVNGYAFVDAHGPEPDNEPAPTDLLEKFGAKANPSPFTIHDSDRRERLHHKMVERIGNKKSGRDSASGSALGKGVGGFTGETPRFLSAPTPRVGQGVQGMTPGRKNIGSLTPAAQRLFENVGGRTPKVGSGGFGAEGSKLGREWTPTPKIKRKT